MSLTVRDVRFAYPGGGFSLTVDAWTVPAGATAGVVGPSGCGKSTLLGLLSGAMAPTAGEVEVAGTAVSRLSEAARRAWRLQNVGLVFQDYPLVEHLDALQNVVLPYRLHPALSLDADVWRRAAEWLEVLGVAHGARRRPARLSQGERQRVAIARALVTEPSVVLADEPTTGLDPDRTDAVMELLTGLTRERGLTLVMVTHDPRLRARFDTVLSLREGRVVEDR